METTNNQFLKLTSERCWLTTGLGATYSGSDTCIADLRVARLLLVLSELDASVDGLYEIQDSELTHLVSIAIEACGFVSPVEARGAIAAVLQAIESPPTMLPL